MASKDIENLNDTVIALDTTAASEHESTPVVTKASDINTAPGTSAVRTNNELSAVFSRVPVPTMVRDNIETWFVQLESWFSLNSIKSDTVKFNTVIAYVEARWLNQVHDAVHYPPAQGKYDNIKRAIVANFAETEAQRLQKLVTGLQLGDQRPSHLLNELRKVGGLNVDEKLLKNLWMQRLPLQARSIVAAAHGNLVELAAVADAVVETLDIQIAEVQHNAIPSTSQEASVRTIRTQPQPPQTQTLMEIEHRLVDLARRLNQIEQDVRSSNQRSRSIRRRSTSRPRDRTPAMPQSTVCWYHREYATEATKCRPPCTFNQTQSSTNVPAESTSSGTQSKN